jgi:hypothetical protein
MENKFQDKNPASQDPIETQKYNIRPAEHNAPTNIEASPFLSVRKISK